MSNSQYARELAILPTTTNPAASSSSTGGTNNKSTNGRHASTLASSSHQHQQPMMASYSINPFPARSASNKLKKFISRLLRPSRWPTMDLELAAWQMSYLCIAPRKVYRQVYYHKQTKNTWARDDPAMLIVLIGLMGLVALLWSALYLRSWSPIDWLAILSRIVLRDFFLSGLIISTILWALCNQFLTHSSSIHAADQRVEW